MTANPAKQTRVLADDMKILVLTVALAIVSLGARPSLGSAPPAIEPLADRIDAVFGRPVVFPVRLLRGKPPAEFEVQIDDGRTIPGSIQWIQAVPPDTSSCGVPAWLTRPFELKAFSVSAPEAGRGVGSWFASLEFPLTGAGQGFWIGQSRYEPNWLPDPRRLASSAGGLGRAWNSPLREEHRDDEILRSLIAPYESHPLLGWRYELCLHGLVPGEEFDAPEPAGPVTDLSALRAEVNTQDAFEPLTDELRALERARWQVALAKLWRADPSLSYPVREALVGAIETPDGVLPFWRADQGQLDDLLEVLLRARSSDEQRVAQVRSWLQSFEAAVSWIIDDAGLFDAVTGEFRPTIGVVNLDVVPVLAWARPGDVGGPSDLGPLVPRKMRTLRGEIVPGHLADGAQEGPGVEVQVGQWGGYLSSIGVVIPAAPPGFALGPFRAEWTLTSWAAMEEPADATVLWDRAAAAMLLRGRSADLGQREARRVGPEVLDERERWMFYIEARIPEGGWSADAATDHIDIWFGPFGSSTRAVRIFADGRIVNLQTGQPAPGFGVNVIRLSDRWVARMPVPDDVIEADGLLRVGVARTDPCGLRSSWPRRLLPGQSEPGRVAVQTNSWDGFGAP